MSHEPSTAMRSNARERSSQQSGFSSQGIFKGQETKLATKIALLNTCLKSLDH